MPLHKSTESKSGLQKQRRGITYAVALAFLKESKIKKMGQLWTQQSSGKELPRPRLAFVTLTIVAINTTTHKRGTSY